ncbi:unnamed protein product [Arctogadus glacialis]
MNTIGWTWKGYPSSDSTNTPTFPSCIGWTRRGSPAPDPRRRFSKSLWPLSHGSPVSAQVYHRYPEGLGAALYREHFDFNAEPPWDPS